jgi:beta-N-acetylglucosaminidase
MVSYKRIFSSLLALSLVFSGFSTLAQAAPSDAEQKALVTNVEDRSVIHVFEEPSEDSDILSDLDAETEVTIVVEEGLDPIFTKVSFKNKETGEDETGYILTENLTSTEPDVPSELPADDVESGLPAEESPDVSEGNSADENPEESDEVQEGKESGVTEDEESSEEATIVPESNDSDQDVEDAEEDANSEEDKPTSDDSAPAKRTMMASVQPKLTFEDGGTTYQGIALKSPTAIYETQSSSSKKIKTYAQGSQLYYKELNKDWYIALVYIKGNATTGFISKKDVTNLPTNQSDLRGVAVSPTKIYTKASTGSSVLKSYSQGSILYYKTLIPGWYECFVYINGVKTSGYINAKDVSSISANQKDLKGIANLSSTPIYTKASSGSKALKSYPKGSTLYYKTFINGWYECFVYINGVKTTGYINASHITDYPTNQKDLKGIANLESTPIYSKLSTDSKVLKSYSKGSILYYKSFIDGWYECFVYINGVQTSGYINASHVVDFPTDQKSYQGVTLKSPTKVYKKNTSSSSVVTSIAQGEELTYKSFTSGWFEVQVTVNGAKATGYIASKDVEKTLPSGDQLKGPALQASTPVYSRASTSSSVLKSYPQGKVLLYEAFSSSWYKAVVFIDGNPKTGYINKKDVKTLGTDIIQDSTDYGITLDEMFQKQMKTNPQTDLYRDETKYIWSSYIDKNGVITENRVNVRSNPSTSSNNYILGTVNKGTKVIVKERQGDWARVQVTWINAKETDVLPYIDPSKVTFGSKQYYQFLKLSTPAYISVAETNQKVLKGKGILDGKGQVFVDAANMYGINEIYLMSHALLETGNGGSELAKGVTYKGQTVYNMFGYGAYDACPVDCGAKYAYEQKWFTPEEAIFGGAKLISQGYIYRENGMQQDTLYKMRWEPSVSHQYASDIGWAVKQVDRIYSIYSLLENYTLHFDLPYYSVK